MFIQGAVPQRLHLNASNTHSCTEWDMAATISVYKPRMVLRLVWRTILGFLRNTPEGGGLAKILKMNRK
jgi:hypothetical protein